MAMNDKNLRAIEISALSVSIIVTTLAMLRAAAGEISSGAFLFILWAVSPHICLFLVDVALRKIAPTLKMSLVFCVTSLLMLGFTLLAYVGTLGDKSSTYGLIFVFVPFYLYIGGIILLIGGLIWALLSKSSTGNNI
jgi:membrane-associated HD superfamily phosphohydrolase